MEFYSETNSSEVQSNTSRVLSSSFSKKKAPSRYHGNRRIRLPYDCAKSVFELGDKLGHQSHGQTIEWLINEAKSSIVAVLEANPIPPPISVPVPGSVRAYLPSPPPPPLPRTFVPFALGQNLTPASISQLLNVSFDLDEEIAKYFHSSD